jgi:hypothetical protein
MKNLIFVFLLLSSFHKGYSQQSNKVKLQEMYDAIKAEGIMEPEYVMGQCIQETGWLTCTQCCLRYNNLFGFYVKGYKCKKFDSREDCIKYYRKWQKERYEKWKKKYPGNDYYHFLKYSKYATGDKYTAELKPKVAWVKKHLKL